MVPGVSLFNQLLQHFPRTEFASLVKKHKAEFGAKGFTCWSQFVAMLFCQLGIQVESGTFVGQRYVVRERLKSGPVYRP